MKGIVLAGGTGSRLFPLTKVTNKHLLPVGEKPMIFYPIEKMTQAGIKEILIVTGLEHMGDVVNLLGSGKEYGCQFTYRVQDTAGGIAQALGLASQFSRDDKMCVILGDNIFHDSIKPFADEFQKGSSKAKIILKRVPDPQRYGVAEVKGKDIVLIEEKPKSPKSDFAVTGIYFYSSDVFEIIRTLKPSGRGELEITDVNNAYIKSRSLSYDVFENWWTDAGTFDSLAHANKLVAEKTAGKMTPKVLVFGATGLVGQEIVERIKSSTFESKIGSSSKIPEQSKNIDSTKPKNVQQSPSTVELLTPSSIDMLTPSSISCDISNLTLLEKFIIEANPNLVINAAATSNVDDAELHPEKAFIINAEAPKVMAQACAQIGASLIHISSDYIFDGEASHPYTEADQRSPISKYGETKARAEEKLLEISKQNTDFGFLIARTSWVYGRGRETFPEVLLKKATKAPKIPVVDDQSGSPTLAFDLAGFLWEAANLLLEKKALPQIIHFSNSGSCSRYEFARAIFKLAFEQFGVEIFNPNHILPVKTSEFPRPARRPAQSPLALGLYEKVFHKRPRTWEDALTNHLKTLVEMGFFKKLNI